MVTIILHSSFFTLHSFNDLRRPVGRVVVNDDDVEGEGCFLLESRADGILYGALAVADGDDDRSLHSKLAFREVHLVVLVAVQIGVQGPQMSCASPFHLHLSAAVARVNIVELLLSAQSRIVLNLSVKELIDVQRQLFSADEEPKVIEGGELVVV